MVPDVTLQNPVVAAHLHTFSKECGSFAHTIFPGKGIHLRAQFSQVNVTFAHIRFSQVNGMFALARLYSQLSQALISSPSYNLSYSFHQTDSIQGTACDEYMN